MKKPANLILLLLSLAAAASVFYLLVDPGRTDRPVARIALDGVPMREIDLSQVETPYSFTIEGTGGLTNTILVAPGCIRVSEADCPDQICVNQGFIFNGTVPIVCLPNKLIIEITGGGESLDAATG